VASVGKRDLEQEEQEQVKRAEQSDR
jgi:hypothetical protein